MERWAIRAPDPGAPYPPSPRRLAGAAHGVSGVSSDVTERSLRTVTGLGVWLGGRALGRVGHRGASPVPPLGQPFGDASLVRGEQLGVDRWQRSTLGHRAAHG